MSTNFYWHIETQKPREVLLPTGERIWLTRGYEPDNAKVHIGLRSGAGFFCWDCNVTLAIGGNREIHAGHAKWHEACPKCGKTEKDGYPTRYEKITEIFPEVVPNSRPTGVKGCCSFIWAQEPDKVMNALKGQADLSIVEDEYGKLYTGAEFATMLQNACPIHFLESIGDEFC